MKTLKIVLLIGISICSFSILGALGEMEQERVRVREPKEPLRVYFQRAFPIMERILEEVMEVYIDAAYDCEAERPNIPPEELEARKINIDSLGGPFIIYSPLEMDYNGEGIISDIRKRRWERMEKRIFTERAVSFGFHRGAITNLLYHQGMALDSSELDVFQDWKQVASGEVFKSFRRSYCIGELSIKDAERACHELVTDKEEKESKLSDLHEELQSSQYKLLERLLFYVIKRDVIFYGEEPDQLRAQFYETIYDGRKELIPIYEAEMEKYKHFSREDRKDLERMLQSVSLK